MKILTSLAMVLALPALAGAFSLSGTTTTDMPAGSHVTMVINGGGSSPIGVDDSAFIFSRTTVSADGWQGNSSAMYSNGCVLPVQSATTVQGAMAVVNFQGTAITLDGQTGTNFGIGAYAIDGGSLTTVDAYNNPGAFPVPLLTISGLANRSHVLSYQVTCNKNTSSSAYYQTLQGATITGTPNEFSAATPYSHVNGNVTFGGSGWQCGGPGNAQDISGGHCWDGTAGDYAEWTFTGSLIEVFIRPDVGDGYFDVQIDGNTVAHDVSGQYTTVDNDQLDAWMAFAESGLSSGSHTIKLVVDGSAPYPNESENSGQKNLLQFDVGLAFP